MVNYSHILRTGWFSSFVFITLLLVITLPFAKAQTACPPDPGGGVRYRAGLDYTTAHTTNFYPQSVPSGQAGDDRATIGSLIMTQPVTTAFPSNVVCIRPVLDNGKTGSVVLNFKYMQFGDAPNAVLKIYQGTSTAVPPTVTINAANAATFPGSSLSYAGPVTVQFESPTPGTSGNFNIDIRFFTGDQVFNSSFGRKAAVWTDFMQPDSYTFIDDQRGTAPNPPYSDNWNPIDIAYFDANRQFVSADRSYCLDSPRSNVGMGFLDYPGKTVFTSYTNFDIDRSGTIDDTDKLKMARLAWLMANRTTVPLGDLRGVQEEVWSIVNSGGGGGSETAVPALPTPAEPTFAISAGVSPVGAGTASTFTVNFNMTGSAPKRLKLVVPAGVTIASVSGIGVTYSGGFLNFASLPGTASIRAISASPQTAQLQVVYEETGFWNVSNLKVYQPCDNGGSVRQDFIGWSQGTVVYPHREASATWLTPTPLTCTDGYYMIDNGTSLFRVNTATGTRTFITSVSGDFNAMGYSNVDNFLWGYDRTTNQVFKLGNGAELFTIPNMPAPASSTSRSVGTVDLNGYLYLYEPNATEFITVDINPGRSTYLQIVDPTKSFTAKTAAPWGTATTARNISDWAYNPATGLIHAMINGAGSNPFFISQLNPVTGVSTLSATPVTGTLTGASEIYDSQFFDANGDLMVYANNAAHWYLVNSATNVGTQFPTTKYPITTGNDGAACTQINSPSSFACSTLYYQVDGDKLYSLDQAGTRTLIATLSGNLNAIGFNTLDNTLWGYDNASSEVFRLGANGVIQRFAISGMPAATQPDGFSVGTVNTSGYLFLYEKNGLNYITVDVNPARTESYLKIVDPTAGYAVKTAAPWGTTLSGGARGISDWAYNPVDNQIYALTDGNASAPYQILQVNPLTGATTLLAGQVTGTGLQTGSQNFGSSFFDAEGNFTVFGNTTGHMYRINTTTKVATQVSATATPSASNDGAFCTSATSPPLPVVLVSFEAVSENTVIRLSWSTASESNNSGFEIERSADAKKWSKQGFVSNLTEGGNSTSLLNYVFTDAAPLKGINYYRLKMIDFDETFAYSRIRSVTMDTPLARMVAYPNPVSGGKLAIAIADTESYKVEVYNLSGVRVLQQNLGKERELNVGGLASGVYVLSVKSATGDVQTSTFIVK